MCKRLSKTLTMLGTLLLLAVVPVLGNSSPASAATGCRAVRVDSHHAYAECVGLLNTRGQFRLVVQVCNISGSCYTAYGKWEYQHSLKPGGASKRSTYSVSGSSVLQLKGDGVETRKLP